MLATLIVSAVLGVHHCGGVLDADLNRDGAVNILDVIDVLLCYGESPCDDGDANRDNQTDVVDLILVLECFGQTEAAMCQWIHITSAAGFDQIRTNLAGNFRVTDSISFPSSWNPIGTAADPFTGTLVADPGVVLENLRIDHPGYDSGTGLFAQTSGARLLDLHLTNVDVTGGWYTAALVGYAKNGTRIEGCSVEGVVNGGKYYNGGIAGRLGHSTIADCHVDVTLRDKPGSGYFTGCITGQVYEGTVTRCSAVCHVPLGWRDVGGIAGRMLYGVVRRSWADVDLNARGAVGALVGGSSSGWIEDCYATGTVAASAANTNPLPWCGGALGIGQADRVRRCWTDVAINYTGSEPSIGAFVGKRGGYDGWYQSNHHPTSPLPSCGVGSQHGLYSHSAAEMQQQATYFWWDFDRVWIMPPSGYPDLR